MLLYLSFYSLIPSLVEFLEMLQVSASIGISFYSEENQATTQLIIDQADKAMYKAKREGKNCFKVVLF